MFDFRGGSVKGESRLSPYDHRSLFLTGWHRNTRYNDFVSPEQCKSFKKDELIFIKRKTHLPCKRVHVCVRRRYLKTFCVISINT